MSLVYRLFPDVERSPPAPRGNPRYASLRLFPDYRYDRQWVYAVGFSNGLVKVGATRQPRLRIREHARTAGDAVDWMRVFAGWKRSHYAFGVEAAACRELRLLCSATFGNEWFQGTPKALVLSVVRKAEAGMRVRVRADDAADALRAEKRAAARARRARQKIEVTA